MRRREKKKKKTKNKQTNIEMYKKNMNNDNYDIIKIAERNTLHCYIY